EDPLVSAGCLLPGNPRNRRAADGHRAARDTRVHRLGVRVGVQRTSRLARPAHGAGAAGRGVLEHALARAPDRDPVEAAVDYSGRWCRTARSDTFAANTIWLLWRPAPPVPCSYQTTHGPLSLVPVKAMSG